MISKRAEESGEKAIVGAEAAHRSATAKREKKAEALEGVRATIAQLREEHASALSAEDPAGLKRAKAAIAEAEVSEEIAAHAFQVAEQDERNASEELERLTREAEARRRRAAVAEKYQAVRELAERQKETREEIIRQHAALNRLVDELLKLGASDRAADVNERRLDTSKWGAFLHRSSDARNPLEPADWDPLTVPVRIRSRVSRYTLFGRTFRDEGDVVQPDEFSGEQWAAIRANENLIASRAEPSTTSS